MTAATPQPTPDLQHRLTLYQSARSIWPADAGESAYDRLRRIVERHSRACPVRIRSRRSTANGQLVRTIAAADLPALRDWALSMTR